LESQRGVDVLSISPYPFAGLARRSDLIVSSYFPPEIEVASQKREVDPGTSQLEAALLKFPLSEPAMMRSVTEIIPEKAMVFLGNSMPIREWNLAATMSPHPYCFANRGANGIDGEVATFLGLSGKEKESWGIFGDLTALYDLNAPAILSQLPNGRRRLVVLNNGGGRIFSRLPAMEQLDAEVKSVTENHHSHRLEAWAEMWKMDYVAWGAGKPAPEIEGGNVVVEVLLDNSMTESFWKELA
jgi:2-succinyl-5-enolpyruvyl-6-hydroxy-3-cyclohexene-1-carboxylate synthase